MTDYEMAVEFFELLSQDVEEGNNPKTENKWISWGEAPCYFDGDGNEMDLATVLLFTKDGEYIETIIEEM